ncbi:MAG: RNA 2',3'-cyclic phosphodiesterase [Pseudomonadota bacterium]
MLRLFVALRPPDAICDQLMDLQAGLAGAAWRPFDAFHLTLRFIGEIDVAAANDVAAALEGVRAPQFSMSLEGGGHFGDRKPRAVWAGATPSTELAHLQAKIERAVQQAGQPPERRQFTPHVTLAYLKGASAPDVAAYLAAYPLPRTQPFQVSHFSLMSSHRGRDESAYAEEARYPLIATGRSDAPGGVDRGDAA